MATPLSQEAQWGLEAVLRQVVEQKMTETVTTFLEAFELEQELWDNFDLDTPMLQRAVEQANERIRGMLGER
jgi:hypothetical protein